MGETILNLIVSLVDQITINGVVISVVDYIARVFLLAYRDSVPIVLANIKLVLIIFAKYVIVNVIFVMVH
jgi:hypothetical protein